MTKLKTKEEERQINLDDKDFIQNETYFFELTIPGLASDSGGLSSNHITPLMLNPQAITLTEPFAVTPTATIGGGLYVEEEGIIARYLNLRGTTGFQPRAPKKGTSYGVSTERFGNVTPEFPMRGGGGRALTGLQSGQRQMQFLQDRVFRLYSDLKKDPAFSRGTVLYFHNPKDGEKYRVIPQSFTLSRAAPRSTMYFYDIKLLVVGGGFAEGKGAVGFNGVATAAGGPGGGGGGPPGGGGDFELIFGDLNFGFMFDAFPPAPASPPGALGSPAVALKKEVLVQEGILESWAGALAEINGIVGEIQGSANSFQNAVREVERNIEATTQLIEGIVGVLSIPFEMMEQLMGTFDQIVDAIENWGGLKSGIYNVMSSMSSMVRSFERSSINLRGFDASFKPQRSLSQIGANFNLAFSAAPPVPAPTAQSILNQGTGPQAGDEKQDRAKPVPPNPGGSLALKRGALSVEVLMGDTIHTMGARYGSRASEIIALNNLKPPYISSTGAPGTLRAGDKILIPSSGKTSSTVGRTTYGARFTDSQEKKLFSTDLKLTSTSPVVGTYLYDLELASSQEDFMLVSGIENLKQGLRTRLLTEIGSDPMVPSLGYRRFVGQNLSRHTERLTKLSLGDAISADSRIISISSVQIQQPTPDSLIIEMEAQPYGMQDRVQLRVER